MMFGLWLYLGRRGWFRYRGLHGCEPWWMPRARVLYDVPEFKHGAVGQAMAIGNAVEYASLDAGSKVVPPNWRPE